MTLTSVVRNLLYVRHTQDSRLMPNRRHSLIERLSVPRYAVNDLRARNRPDPETATRETCIESDRMGPGGTRETNTSRNRQESNWNDAQAFLTNQTGALRKFRTELRRCARSVGICQIELATLALSSPQRQTAGRHHFPDPQSQRFPDRSRKPSPRVASQPARGEQF